MRARIHHLVTLSLSLICSYATAEPKREDAAIAPIKCYEQAWGSKENPGLGLNVGQAVELCSGATDPNKPIQCFIKAFAHRDDGGLGLNIGQAVRLCKTNPQSRD